MKLKGIGSILKILKHFRLNSLFLRIFISILAIMLVLVVFNFGVLNYIKNIMQEKEIKSQDIVLNYCSLYIDNVLKKINDVMYILEYDSDIKVLLRLTDRTSNEYDKMATNAIKKITVMNANIDEINSIHIYAHKSDAILFNGGTSSPETYFKNRYKGDYRSWLELLKKRHNLDVNILNFDTNNDNAERPSNVLMMNTIRDGNTSLGLIAVNLDKEFITKLFSGNEFSNNRKIYMTTGTGKIISRNQPEQSHVNSSIEQTTFEGNTSGSYFTKDGYLVSYKKAALFNCYYVIYTPVSLIFQNVAQIRNIANALLLYSLIACILFALFVSQRLYSPFGNIIDFLGLNSMLIGRKQNEMKYIEENISEIVRSNNTLKNTVSETMPVIIEIVLFKLLLGGKEIQNAIFLMNEYDINFKEGLYMVCLCRKHTIVDNFNALLDNEQELKQFFNTIQSGKALGIIKLKSSEYAAMLYLETEKQFESIISEMNHNWQNSDIGICSCYTGVGVGLPCKDLLDIHTSYCQASEAFDSRRVQDNQKIFVKELQNSDRFDKISIPGDMEQRIMKGILSGNIDVALKYAEEILDSNCSKNITYNSFYRLCMSMQSVITRIICDWSFEAGTQDRDWNGLIIDMDECYDADALKQRVLNNIKALAGYFQEKKKSEKYIDKVIEYVDNNYNKDINLEIVADKFDMNASYLSKLFKQENGMSFTDYLNTKKVDMAKKLLANTSKTIKDIAVDAGYNSPNMFIRTFERFEGVSPGEYRKKMLESTL